MRLVLVGGGGHARVAADVARSAGMELWGVLTPEGGPVAPGLERLGGDEWIEVAPAGIAFHLAFGPRPGDDARAALFERLTGRGLSFPAIVSATADVRPGAGVGEGTLVVHGAILNAGARVGRNCIVNTGAIVEHDCAIGDHSHIAPGARLGGGVRVGERCILGLGAVVLPGIAIAEGVTVGAGAVLVRDIEEPGSTWSGNPARRHA
jgi:UDP-perosamine 4-acetyltransferase